MRFRRDSGLKRALVWLVAAACLVVLTLARPRASTVAEGGARAPSASVAPARDAGQALVRSTPAVSVAAPAADPLPLPVTPAHACGLSRAPNRALEVSGLVALGAGVRVVRWQRHVPRMDSGEPPRHGDVSS